MAMHYDVSWVEALQLGEHLNAMARTGWSLRHLQGEAHGFIVVMEQNDEVIELRPAATRVRELSAERVAEWPSSR